MRHLALPLLLALAAPALAAPPPAKAAPAAKAAAPAAADPLSAQERAQAVARVLEELEQRYVFPDVARRHLPELRRRWAPERLARHTRAGALVDALNADLAELFRDGHLRVLAPPPGMPRPSAGEGPEAAAELERFLARQNYQVRRAEVLPGNVGYVRVDGFGPAKLEGVRRAVARAMAFVADTDALIVDIRRNGGGEIDGVANLVSYFVEGRVHLLDAYDGITRTTEASHTREALDGPRYGAKRPLFVLTSASSFSAAEEFAYDLQGLKRATLVGETTAGGANNNTFVRLSEHLDLSLPFGTVKSAFTGTNWEGKGVRPDVEVEAGRALKEAHGRALRQLEQGADPAGQELLRRALAWLEKQPDEPYQSPRAPPRHAPEAKKN